MVRALPVVLILVGAGLWSCSSTPAFETRAYALLNRDVEEPLIRSVLDDEAARLGPKKLGEVLERYGNQIEILKFAADGTAIVRTTAHGHEMLGIALGRAREQAQGVAALDETVPEAPEPVEPAAAAPALEAPAAETPAPDEPAPEASPREAPAPEAPAGGAPDRS